MIDRISGTKPTAPALQFACPCVFDTVLDSDDQERKILASTARLAPKARPAWFRAPSPASTTMPVMIVNRGYEVVIVRSGRSVWSSSIVALRRGDGGQSADYTWRGRSD